MAKRTITRLYDSHDIATQAVQALERAGIPQGDISLVANNADSRTPATSGGTTATGPTSGDLELGAGTGAGTNATLGTVLGGGAGLLACIGTLVIPGVGPIVAAGWLVATLTGAGVGPAAGGLLGSLTGAGVSEADAHAYAKGVRRGGALVAVRAHETMAGTVEYVFDSSAFDSSAPVNLATRRAEYDAEGWTRHDAAAPPYTPEQVAAERRRRRVVQVP